MRSLRFSPGFSKVVAPLVGVALVAALSVPAIYWAESSSLAAWSRRTERHRPKKAGREIFRSPGVPSPPTAPAADARLDDDQPILGVESGGASRAYHQGSLAAKARHVVNDVVGGRAVTVTFCDLDDCARAFGGEPSSKPLEIAVEGLDEGGMLLGVGGVAYFQRTGEAADPVREGAPPRIPFAPVPVTRTTWGRWKALHPDTDLYVHRAPSPAPGTPAP